MERALPVLLLILPLAIPAHSFDEECTAKLTQLGSLYQVRSMMARSYTSSSDVQRFADRRIDELREPLREGGHRWIRWVRPPGDGPFVKKEHSVLAVQGGDDRDRVEAAGGHVYAASVVVPRKRSLFHNNHAVWVGTAEVTYEIDGRPATRREAINQWMNPGTSRTIDLGGIAEHARATLDSATSQRHMKQALVEIHLRQAVAEDDPANPTYSTVQMLQRIRQSPDAATVDAEVAAAEASLYPGGGETLPMLTLLGDLRRADELMRSSKEEEQEKGSKLLKETLSRLR
ncbi:MAG TPA: hypothetical protein VNA04_08850 [Thermoanaerobaculia bacterium]|nr:hypothetical protein [Thermoanaerobaculia bacterium]